MTNVLLAADGSDYARRAATRAIEEAAARDAALHVLCVVDRRIHGEPGLSTDELTTIETEDRGHRFVEAIREDATTRGLDVTGAVKHGIPEDVVLEYADDIDAALIVVGEHGDHEDHVGGVGRAIANASDRDVLVAPGRV